MKLNQEMRILYDDFQRIEDKIEDIGDHTLIMFLHGLRQKCLEVMSQRNQLIEVSKKAIGEGLTEKILKDASL